MKRPEDVDSNGADHGLDAMRCGWISWATEIQVGWDLSLEWNGLLRNLFNVRLFFCFFSDKALHGAPLQIVNIKLGLSRY